MNVYPLVFTRTLQPQRAPNSSEHSTGLAGSALTMASVLTNQPVSQSSNKHQPHSPSGQPAKNSGKKKVGEFSSRVITQAAFQSVSCSVL